MERRIVITYKSRKRPELETIEPGFDKIGPYVGDWILHTESLQEMRASEENACVNWGRQEKVSECLEHVFDRQICAKRLDQNWEFRDDVNEIKVLDGIIEKSGANALNQCTLDIIFPGGIWIALFQAILGNHLTAEISKWIQDCRSKHFGLNRIFLFDLDAVHLDDLWKWCRNLRRNISCHLLNF